MSDKFDQSILRFAVKVEVKSQAAVQAVCTEFFSRVVARTPVDTGALRAAWECGPSGNPRGQSFDIPLDGAWYMVNRLPYAPVVEYGLYPNPPKNPTGKTVNGFSRQAPQGMVRITAVEFGQIVSEVRVS